MALALAFLPGRMGQAARIGAVQPLAFPDHQLTTPVTTAPTLSGNAIAPVTGGRRPHRVSFVAPGGTVALIAGVQVLTSAADAAPGPVGTAFAAIMGGTLPYQVTQVVTG